MGKDQNYWAGLVPTEAHARPAGPAFLQNLGNDSPEKKLTILSEVFRCAREIYPATSDGADLSVTIRIDAIKALSTQEIQDSVTGEDLWMLVKHNEQEAIVERASARRLGKFSQTDVFALLDVSLP